MIRNTLIFLLLSNIVFGQNLKDTKINVSKKYNPSVIDANRLDDQAVYVDTIKIKNTFDYDFISMQIKTKPNIRPLKPALVKNQKFLNNNLNKIELSLGNKFYSDAYLNFSKKIRENLFFGIASSNNRIKPIMSGAKATPILPKTPFMPNRNPIFSFCFSNMAMPTG